MTISYMSPKTTYYDLINRVERAEHNIDDRQLFSRAMKKREAELIRENFHIENESQQNNSNKLLH